MWIDIAIVLLLGISFLAGQKAIRFIFKNHRSENVIVNVTLKDGRRKQYLVSREKAQEIIATAKANKV